MSLTGQNGDRNAALGRRRRHALWAAAMAAVSIAVCGFQLVRAQKAEPGWALVAPESVQTAAEFLNALPEGTRLFGFDGEGYPPLAPGDAVLPGRGYWAFFQNSSNGPANSPGAGSAWTGSLTVELAPGWNAVGNPFDADVSWKSDCFDGSQSDPDSPCSENALLSGPFGYDGRDYATADALRPFTGYWVRNDSRETILLTFDPGRVEDEPESDEETPDDGGTADPDPPGDETTPGDETADDGTSEDDAGGEDPSDGTLQEGVYFSRPLAEAETESGAPGEPLRIADEILAALPEGIGPEEADQYAAEHGLEIVGINPALGLYQFRILDGADPSAKAAELAGDGAAQTVAPDYLLPLADFRVPNDPPYQAGLAGEIHAYMESGAPYGWGAGTPAGRAVIAVVDTGVDFETNADLAGKQVEGVNFVGHDASDAHDAHGHGTTGAAAAAARGDDGQGMAGVCWDCRVMPVKVCDDEGRCPLFALLNGIAWAADRGADVAAVSLGATLDDPAARDLMNRAVDYATEKGTLVIAAAGNAGASADAHFPAAAEAALSVAAANASNARASFSNYGASVDLSAYGENVYVSRAGGGYGPESGTSIAAALAAGTAGLMKSFDPGLTPADLRRILTETATPILTDRPLGAGLLDIGAAVGGAIGQAPVVRVAGARVEPASAALTAGESLTFTATAFDEAGRPMPADFEWSVVEGGGTLDPNGTFTAGPAGTIRISAQSGGVKGEAVVTATPSPVPVRLAIEPSEAGIKTGGSVAFQAAGFDAYENEIPVQDVVWSASGGVGSIDERGLFTANAAGEGEAVAAAGGLTASARIAVSPGDLARMEITPATSTAVAGRSVRFSAAGYDAYGAPVAAAPVWAIAGEAGVFSDEEPGLLTVYKAGERRVTARAADVAATALAVVTPGPAASLELEPGPAALKIGDSLAPKATLRDPFGNETTDGDVAWSADAAIGSVTANGVFTASSAGRGLLTASLRGTSAPPARMEIWVAPDVAASPDAASLSSAWKSVEKRHTWDGAWGDYDSDGDLDIAFANQSQQNQIYRNDGAFSFTQVWTSAESEYSTGVAWGDYDRDGDLDLAVSNANAGNLVYRNDGGGSFSSAWRLSAASEGTTSIAWGDADADGDLDLFCANGGQSRVSRIYLNLSGRGFEPGWETPFAQNTYALSVADLDGDGDLDFVEGNRYQTNIAYSNNGAGGFAAAWNSFPDMDPTYGLDAADYDGDGDLDLAAGNWNGTPDRTYRNDGGFSLAADWTSPETDDTRSVAFGDYDGDGDPDLATGAGDLTAARANRVYRNEGGTFALAWTSAEEETTFSTAWGDADGDGNLDLLASNWNAQSNRVYRNDGGATNAPPAAPWGLNSTEPAPGAVTLSWTPAADDRTPAAALTYDVRVGTVSNPCAVHCGAVSVNPGNRGTGPGSVAGRSFSNPGLTLKPPSGSYLWAVRAVDAGFSRSPWSAEGAFELSVALDPPLATDQPTAAPVDGESLASSADGTLQWAGDQALVLFDANASVEAIQSFLNENALQAVGGDPARNIYQLRILDGASPQDVAARLENDPLVDGVSPNYILAPAGYLPNDPIYHDASADEEYAFLGVRADGYWNAAESQASPLTAVVDTGVDAAHPDLIGRVEAGKNFAGPDPSDTGDVLGHGTAMASIIAGRGDDGQGMAGVCWNCRVLPVKVCDDSGRCPLFALLNGISWASDRGADVINVSLGAAFADPATREIVEAIVRSARDKGALVVASAGNAGTDGGAHYPAAAPSAFNVASVDRNGARSSFSNYGPAVDLSAYGEAIHSARPGGGFGSSDGTSAAAALVSGAAGLLKTYRPDASPAQIETALKTSAAAIQTDQPLGEGLLDASAALEALQPALALEAREVTASPAGATVAVGGLIEFQAKAFNGSGAEIAVPFAWSVPDGHGTVDADGRYTGIAPGTGRVSASAGGATGEASVSVVEAPSQPGAAAVVRIVPPPPVVEAGSTHQFTAVMRDALGLVTTDGTPLWSFSGTAGAIDPATGLFTAVEAGEGTAAVELSGGASSDSVVVYVVPEGYAAPNAAPVVTDNQAGDNTWRTANTGTYNVDFSDADSDLDFFEIQACSASANCGDRIGWTTVTAWGGGTGSETADWALPAAVWTALADGSSNYISVRVTDQAVNTDVVGPAFFVKKDTVSPVVSITSPAASAWVGSPSFILGASDVDAGGVFSCEYMTESWDGFSWNGTQAWTSRTTCNSAVSQSISVGAGLKCQDETTAGEDRCRATVRATDNVGNQTTSAPRTFRVDYTAPTDPGTPNDGTGADIDAQTNGTTLSANWTTSTDALSGFKAHLYSIGTSAGASDTVVWTSVGVATSVTKGGLALADGQTYYVNVAGQDNAGNVSSIVSTDGVLVDASAPSAPATVNDGAGADIDFQTSTTTLSANWTASADAHTGVSLYWYSIGTAAGASDVVSWTNNGAVASVTKSGLTLTDGQIYYVNVVAQNGVGSIGAVTSSDGVTVDVSGPSVTINNPAASSWQTADFDIDVSDADASGIASCEYTVESGGAGSWTTTRILTARTACNSVNSQTITVGASGFCQDEGADFCRVAAQATDNMGNTAAATRTFSIDFNPPGPGPLSISSTYPADQATDSVTLHWTAVSDVNWSNYDAYWNVSSPVDDGVNNIGSQAEPLAATAQTTISGLTEDTTYYFILYARDSLGHATASNELTVKTLDNPALSIDAAPVHMKNRLGHVRFVVSVDDHDSEEYTLTVEYSTDGGTVWNPATVASASVTAGVDAGTPITIAGNQITNIDTDNINPTQITGYWDSLTDGPSIDQANVLMRFTADDPASLSDRQTSGAVEVDNVAPSGLGKLSLNSKTFNSLILGFPAPVGEPTGHYDKYAVFYSTSAPVTEADTAHADANLLDINFNGASLSTLSGLSEGTAYFLNIWASDTFGNLVQGTQVAFTTMGRPVPTFQIAPAQGNDGFGDTPMTIQLTDIDATDTVSLQIQWSTDTVTWSQISFYPDPAPVNSATATVGFNFDDATSAYQIADMALGGAAQTVWVNWDARADVGANTEYDTARIRVRAVDQIGNISNWATSSAFITDHSPPTFQGIKTAVDAQNPAGASTQVALTWTAATDLTDTVGFAPIYYTIYEDAPGPPPATPTFATAGPPYPYTPGGYSYVATGAVSATIGAAPFTPPLTTNDVYYYLVRAMDKFGNEDSNYNQLDVIPCGFNLGVDDDSDGHDDEEPNGCDGIDNDKDGLIDEDVTNNACAGNGGYLIWHADIQRCVTPGDGVNNDDVDQVSGQPADAEWGDIRVDEEPEDTVNGLFTAFDQRDNDGDGLIDEDVCDGCGCDPLTEIWNDLAQVCIPNTYFVRWKDIVGERSLLWLPGVVDGELHAPYGIALDGSNPPLLITSDTLNDRMQVFDATLAGTPDIYDFAHGFGSPGSGDDELNNPEGLDYFGGEVYICDRRNSAIKVWTVDSSSAAYQRKWTLYRPLDIVVVDASNIFTIDEAGKLRKWDSVGTEDVSGNFPLTIAGAKGLETDGTNLYVADFNGDQVRKYDLAGNAVAGFDGTGTLGACGALCRIDGPYDIAYYSTENALFVTDFNNSRVIRLDAATGQWQDLWGTEGYLQGNSSKGRFMNPRGIVVNSNGDIVVADAQNWRLQALTVKP